MHTVVEKRTATAGKRLAAIDIGSNSIRLLVAEIQPDGTYHILDDEKRTTRLAKGLAETAMLDDESMQQSFDALNQMQAVARDYGVDRLKVIATSAMREAENGPEFSQRVHDELGLPIDIITPEEEARLSFASVSRHFDLRNTNVVCVDLGGGSAEIVLAARGAVEEKISMPIGAVRLTEKFIKSDPPGEKECRRLKRHVRRAVRGTSRPYDFVPHLMIGAGGTFTALAHIAMRRNEQSFSTIRGYELDRSEVRHILDYLQSLDGRARRNVPGLNADRADIIVAGLLVIEQLMREFHINSLQIHDGGVRNGLLLQMIDETAEHSPYRLSEKMEPLAAVRRFARNSNVEMKHAEHIARLSTQLFDQLQPAFGLPAEERQLLEAAAVLHEIGYLINYEKHHHHSYHLILHGDLPGLTPRQREIVANVARYHRRARPKKKHHNFARLRPGEQDTVRRLSAILRLVDGLDRTHMQRIHSIQVTCKGKTVLLTLQADQSPEVDIWGGQRKGRLFERVLDVNLEFEWQPKVGGNGRAG